MIVRTPYGNHEVRSGGGDYSGFIPQPGSDEASTIGGSRRRRDLTVTAVGCAVRLVADTIGGLVLRVYQGHGIERRPLLDDYRARLFQHPADDVSSMELWGDVATSLELEEHAFLWKVKVDGRVEELLPCDPQGFRVKRVGGATGPKMVEARVNGRAEDVTDRVIHIRGWSDVPGVNSLPVLTQHRQTILTARAFVEYQGRYFENDATPGIVLEHPGRPNLQQRRDLLAAWMRRHSGPRNAGRPGLVWGGTKVTTLSSSMRDAQGAEIADSIARDVARALRIYPADLLHASLAGTRLPASAEVWGDLFVRFSLLGRLRRIERGLAADPDLFPDWVESPRFDTLDLTRGDIRTQADTIRDLVQVGVETPNEGRAAIGLPPHPDGDVLNWPPVGATSPAKGGGGSGSSDPNQGG